MYNLVVLKGGMKLADPKEGSCVSADPNGPPLPPAAPGLPFIPPCGRVIFAMTPTSTRLYGGKTSMARLVFTLSNVLGRTVVDKTGFAGVFDLSLEFARNDALAGTAPLGAFPVETAQTGDSKPSIFAALQDELGLKLESTKGPVEVLTIDSAEKPSEN